MNDQVIWIISSELPPDISGGLGTHVGCLARGLAARGRQVHIVLLPYYADHAGESYHWEGCQVHPLPFPAIGNDEQGRVIYQQTLEQGLSALAADYGSRPALVHGHEWFGYLCGRHLAECLQAPLVTTFHIFSRQAAYLGQLDQPGFDRPGSEAARLVLAAEQAAGQGSRRLIYVSHAMRTIGEEHYGFPAAAGRVVHNCLDQEMEEPPSQELVADMRRRFVGDGDLLVCATGRMIAQKGFYFLVQAMLPLANALPGLRLVLAGQGPMEDFLRREAAAYGNRVGWAGFLSKPELRALIAASDIGVVPSVFEPFGIAALDFMQAGVAVVATAAGGLQEIIAHQETGWLVPLRMGRAPIYNSAGPMPDVNNLASSLMALARNHHLRKRLAAAGQQAARREFSLDRFLDKTMAVYEEL